MPASLPRYVLSACLALLLASPLLYSNATQAQQPPASTAAANARPVVVASPKQMRLAETALVTGTAEANAYVEIRPEISGRVTKIHFTEGSQTPEGSPLVSLDSRAAEARRDEAKAELANAEQQLDRAKALRSGSTVTAARIDELTAAVEIARARLRVAEVDLDQHTIRMPFNGIIGLRRISVGAQVDENSILTTADDSSLLNVVFRVPDVWLGNIRTGLQVSMIPAQDAALRLSGTVTAIDSRVDATSRTIGVKAEVKNPDGVIKPGSLIKIEVPLQERTAALVVPEQSILTTGEQNSVFIVRDGKAIRQNVQLGLRQTGVVEITQGLQLTDTVISAGADRLRDGAAVNAAQTLEGWSAP